MSEPVRVQVSLDEKAKERLRQMAGQGQASVAFVLGRVIESGLMEKKRLMSGIVQRLELAQRGALVDSDRAGVVQVPLAPKLALQLGQLGEALDHTASGVAGLIVKVVLDDQPWLMSLLVDTIGNSSRPR